MTHRGFILARADGLFAICRLPPGSGLPVWFNPDVLGAVVVDSSGAVTVVSREELIPKDLACSRDWVGIYSTYQGNLDEVGVLNAIVQPLANNSITVLAFSTYDSDVVFVRNRDLAASIRCLRDAGHSFANCEAF